MLLTCLHDFLPWERWPSPAFCRKGFWPLGTLSENQGWVSLLTARRPQLGCQPFPEEGEEAYGLPDFSTSPRAPASTIVPYQSHHAHTVQSGLTARGAVWVPRGGEAPPGAGGGWGGVEGLLVPKLGATVAPDIASAFSKQGQCGICSPQQSAGPAPDPISSSGLSPLS